MYNFLVTYCNMDVALEDPEHSEYTVGITVDNPEVKTEKVAFQVCVMKAYEQKASNVSVVSIMLSYVI